MNCQHCQTLLLDHLYGLLDTSEVATLDAHLASCPSCAAARAETARMQGLIAVAAKSAFPNTKFAPPITQPRKSSTHTPVPGTPAVLPFPANPNHKSRGVSRRVAAVIPWAVAAAVLLAIPGTIIPVLGIFNRAESTKRDAEFAKKEADSASNASATAIHLRQRALSDAEFQCVTAEQSQVAILNKWVDEQKSAVESATARRFSVDVLKPATVQPGAPNDFLVVVNDRRDPWETTGKNLVAEIHAVDASDAVIFTQPLNIERTAERKHPLRLPASAWSKVKPDAELYLVVAQVDEKTQTRTELQERIRLAGPVFTTLLVTDKSTYRPGERLFFRSLTLDRISFKAPAREQILKYELFSPTNQAVNGAVVTGTTDLVHVGVEGRVEPVRLADGKPVRGVGCGEFVLPPELPDGDYTLKLTEFQHPGGFPATVPLPVTRVVKIRAGTVDNYRKRIDFTNESYVPGNTVEGWAELKFQDKPMPNAAVEAVAVEIDGQRLTGVQVSKETDANGRAQVRFTLPPEVLVGDVRLKVTFRTPHGEESVAKRVPIIGNRVIVEFFPESGDTLVAGVPCKVYVRATTPAGQPVNFRGIVTDGRQTLARVESLNDKDQPGVKRGLGSFTYTPELGTRVWLKLESPSSVYAPIMLDAPVPVAAVALMGGPGAVGTRTGFPLPEAKPDGVVMSVLDPITSPGEPIRVKLYSVGQARQLVVGAYTRGKLSDTQRVIVEPDVPQIVKLMAGTDPRGGVVRITAFDEFDEKQDLRPVAERLVFRKPGQVLNLAFAASSAEANTQAPGQPIPAAPAIPAPKGFAPGAPITLSITATDEKANPAAAILWAATVNSGVALGEKDRLLPTHFLLAGEVQNPEELEYADFLLTDQKNAGEALDLLLGTQGWRRFAEQSPAPVPGAKQQNFLPPSPEMVRLMLQNGQFSTRTEPVPIRNHRDLYQKYAPLYEAAVKKVAQAKAKLEAAHDDTSELRAITQANSAAESARYAAEEQTAKAEAARAPVQRFHANVWYGVAGLAALAMCCGLASFMRADGWLPLGFSTLGSIGLAAFLVVAASWGTDAKATAQERSTNAPMMAKAEMEIAPAPHEVPGPDAAIPPSGPVGSNMEGKGGFGAGIARKDTPPDRVTDGGAQTQLQPGVVPQPAPREVRPQLTGYPPPVILPGVGRYSETKLGNPAGMGGMIQPIVPGVPTPVPPPAFDPLGGRIALPAMPGSGAEGWDPKHLNGVTSADTVNSQSSLFYNLRSQTYRTRGVTEYADALKKATDRAAKFAYDRNTALVAPIDGYYAGRGKAAANVPETPVQQSIEVYAVEKVRGTVSSVPPLVVREFAAPRPTPAPIPDAIDSPDTVLWQPIIVLPSDGKATLHFSLGHAPNGYEIIIAGHTTDGRLGAIRDFIPVTPLKSLAPGGQAVPGGAVLPPMPVAPPPPPMP